MASSPAALLQISPEVAAALRAGQPVVALESTLITHGLPYPANETTALAMEAAVRESGAVPATIAVLAGRITVGLSPAEIARLASLAGGRMRKCSRRDLPIAMALREDAATTVAGTMAVAHLAGIPVLATGGIGGVHRGLPFDVSADLTELGRTPVAVVSSGAKSILDLPLTLEALESRGVPIIGFGTDTFPGFYTRSTGLTVDARVDDAQAAAAIIQSARQLPGFGGLLIVVPVPEADALSAADIEGAIQQAVAEAEAQGVRGKALTPWMLARIAILSGGASQRANVSLLINNARQGGRIAAALAVLP